MNLRARNRLVNKINKIMKHMDSFDWEKIDAQIHADTVSYNRSCARLGLKHSPETKEKIRDALKGLTFPKVRCSYCGLIGSGPAMKRWHFEACAKKLLSDVTPPVTLTESPGDSRG